jgi:3-oxoacyl-[acyl-carrier-protein] synthase II
MDKRVVITGIGLLSSIGKDKRSFWNALKEGQPGYAPITLFDPAEFNVHQACEVKDFDAKEYLGAKGLRTLDRSTRLVVSAAKLAIDDSKLSITDENTDQIGVSVGCTLGSLKSISDFDVVTLKEGPRYTNPALFPNTVINSPASQISIWHHIQGFNTTISTGFTASLDAMSYAADFIQLDRANAVLAGGVEEMCEETFFGFHELRFLSGSKKGENFINCPFDRRRNGVTLGEGAAILVMEDEKHAKDRRADVLGRILGFGQYFDPYRINKYNPAGTGMKEAMKKALDAAGVNLSDIDYICANANSTQEADKIEAQAIKDVFGSKVQNIPVSSIKSMIGETYSVSGAFAVAAALGALNEQFIPKNVNLKDLDSDCAFHTEPKGNIKTVLVNVFGPSGNCGCVVVGK